MGDRNQARDGPVGAHTNAGRQCADPMEAGVRADEPARILHTGTRSGALRGRKAGGDAYVIPDWAGKMASYSLSPA